MFKFHASVRGWLRFLFAVLVSGLPVSLLAQTATPAQAASVPFTTTASVSLVNIAPGATQTISWSVQSSAATTVALALGIYDSTSTKVSQQNLTAVSFTAGQTRTYTYTWTAPANEKLGTHSVQIGVFSPDWSTTLNWNASAAQFGVLNATFTAAAAISTSSIIPGGSQIITWTVQSATAMTAAVALGVYDPAGTKVGVQDLGNEVFAAGQTKTYSFTWQAPTNATLGTYGVQVGAGSVGWTKTYVWNKTAAVFGLTATTPPTTPGYTTTASVPAINIVPGASQVITWTVQSNTASNVSLALGIYDSASTKVSQQNVANETFWAGQTKTYSYAWTAPLTEKLGTHTVQIGVSSPDWSTTLSWNANAAQFGVLNPTFTAAAAVSASSIIPGGSQTITWTVQSATAMTAAVRLGIYDPSGTRVSVQDLSNEVFAAGQTKTYSFNWGAPANAALGTYAVQVGAGSLGWTQTYVWNVNAAQFGLTATTPPTTPGYTTTASVPAINIVPGASQVITWTVQSNTASNVSLALGIYDSASTKVSQQNVANETFWAGQTKTYSYTWTAPLSEKLGTHTVQIGVSSPDWSTTLSWNASAAQFGVLNPTFTATAGISASSIIPGGSQTITWTVQSATGMTAAAALGIYNPAGTKVGVQDVSNEVFAAGQTKTYSFTWQAPTNSTLGTYVVQVGAGSVGWSKTYVWNRTAAQFGLTATTPPTTPGYTSTASSSPIDVSPGATDTLNWTVQSNTPTTVALAMGIYDSSGTKLAQQNMPSEMFWAGQSKAYAYAWSLPSNLPLGTYTAEVGVYSLDWSQTLTNNVNAGFVRVVGASQQGSCSPSLQLQIDTASAGSVLNVRPCMYRESVSIDKPLTLIAPTGTEVRGSDVWTNWTPSGAIWTHAGLPALRGITGTCDVNVDCTWLGELFMDGALLTHVGSNPTTGQWASDGSGNVTLADNPNGHTVELATRSSWVTVNSDNVTIQGFTMQHLANDADTGGVMSTHVDNVYLTNNTFAFAHGANVFLRYGKGHQVLNNDVHDAGQVGIEGFQIDSSVINSNTIHGNATAGYSSSWGAAGVKVAGGTNVTMDSNTVYANLSHGLWCDITCNTVTFSNNRVYDNTSQGIHFEVSNGAKIFGNVLWNNSVPAGGGWGADIYVSSASNAEVYNNTVFATRTHGIFVASQNRTDYPASKVVTGDYVHDNTIIMNGLYNGNIGRTGLAWIEDWAGTLWDPASNNRGLNNGFWFSYPEQSWQRFNWNSTTGGQWTLADFAATQGGAGSTYLTDAQRDQAIAAANIPASAWSR